MQLRDGFIIIEYQYQFEWHYNFKLNIIELSKINSKMIYEIKLSLSYFLNHFIVETRKCDGLSKNAIVFKELIKFMIQKKTKKTLNID